MKFFISLIFCSLLFFACKKEDVDPGIILQEVDLGYCIPQDVIGQEYVIESDSMYQLLLGYSVCPDYSLPYIDFNAHTLLGKFASGQCKVSFQPQVLKDELSKQYNFVVYVFDRGICKSQGMKMNWVLVPKLPPNWVVKFDVRVD